MSQVTQLLSGEEGLDQTIQLLKDGECVALPTETVYGLAADASNDAAVAGIFAAKGRPTNHPLIVHVANYDQVAHWAIDVPESAVTLAESFWPGPLTLLLHKAPAISSVVTGGHETIALRSPSHPLFHKVLELSGMGLAAPSANRYKKLSPTTAEQVMKGMQGRIAAVLDGGPCEFGLESTILDLTAPQPTIVRAGPIDRAAIEAVLGEEVLLPAEHDVAVPGNVAAHYQPETQLQMFTNESIPALTSTAVGYLVYSDKTASKIAALGGTDEYCLKLPEDARGYGKLLYAALHQLDSLGLAKILVERPPSTEPWAAVNDRLMRALG